jgi:hypothetical protein
MDGGADAHIGRAAAEIGHLPVDILVGWLRVAGEQRRLLSDVPLALRVLEAAAEARLTSIPASPSTAGSAAAALPHARSRRGAGACSTAVVGTARAARFIEKVDYFGFVLPK